MNHVDIPVSLWYTVSDCIESAQQIPLLFAETIRQVFLARLYQRRTHLESGVCYGRTTYSKPLYSFGIV